MKAFVSWSGGKDCMLALYRFLQEPGNEIVGLINMCDESSDLSRSHGLTRHIIASQAACMKIPVFQLTASWSNYEEQFKKAITQLKSEGATAGVFGDIYLNEHRIWIEQVCNDMDVIAIFPLWKHDTMDLLREFIHAGFKALTVSVHSGMLSQNWLGREINTEFFDEITSIDGIDACAENGEYHSFVYDGPLFKTPVQYVKNGISEHDNHYFLEISKQ